MDTSETYIKMCEKAEEIQLLTPWPKDEKDYFQWESTWETKGEIYYLTGYRYICWLPRIDQLQEMMKGHPLEVLDKFHTFCMWDDQFEEMREKMTPISMEQLWLAFVMHEKFHKVWIEEEWRNGNV